MTQGTKRDRNSLGFSESTILGNVGWGGVGGVSAAEEGVACEMVGDAERGDISLGDISVGLRAPPGYLH